MNEEEVSIPLHQELLEAATVAAADPPDSVIDLNEGDFEDAARSALHDMASPLRGL